MKRDLRGVLSIRDPEWQPRRVSICLRPHDDYIGSTKQASTSSQQSLILPIIMNRVGATTGSAIVSLTALHNLLDVRLTSQLKSCK